MEEILHTAHAVLAGTWLGTVVFTAFVVSPAFEKMKWDEPERVLVRSKIGRRYAKVGGANLALLAVFAVLDGATGGFDLILYAELVLLVAVIGLVAVHGAYFGKRLAALAAEERKAANPETAAELAGRRRSLQRLSLRVSRLDLVLSAVVAVLAVNA